MQSRTFWRIGPPDRQRITYTPARVCKRSLLNVHTFLAGVRVAGHSGPIRIFGQFLVGAAQASGGGAVSGGGISISSSASETDQRSASRQDRRIREHADSISSAVGAQHAKSVHSRDKDDGKALELGGRVHLLSRIMWTGGLVVAFAQTAAADEGPRADFAGGYSLVYDHEIKTTFAAGWFVSAAVNANKVVALAGEVSGHYNSQSVHTFLGGPRLISGTGAARFFGQFLVGAATASAGTAAKEFCYMPAVGLDIGFNPKTALRIGAGERFIRAGGGSTATQFQFVAGLVHRFEK